MQLLKSLFPAIGMLMPISVFAACILGNEVQKPTYYSYLIQQSNPTPKLVPIPAKWIIIPGISAGQTHINENMIAVLKRLGKPDYGDAAMGKSMSIWYAGHNSTNYETAIVASRYTLGTEDTASLVQEILVTSPKFRLQNGIHTGVSHQQVATKYKLAKAATLGKSRHRLTVYRTSKGIDFEFNAAGTCTGIYIHAIKYQSNVAYLAFHPELERTK